MPDPVDTYRHRSQDELKQTSNQEHSQPAPHAGMPPDRHLPTGCPPSQRLKKSARSRMDFQEEELIEPNESPPSGIGEQPMEQMLARELAETLSGTETEASSSEDPDKHFEKACRDLVNKAKQDMAMQDMARNDGYQQMPPEMFGHGENFDSHSENVDDEFVRMAAANRKMMDWSSSRDYEAAQPTTTQPEMVGILPENPPPPSGRYARTPSLAAGMTAVIIAIATTGVMLDVHKHPVVSGGLEWVSGPVDSPEKQNVSTENDTIVAAKPTEPATTVETAKKAERVVVEVASVTEPAKSDFTEDVAARMVSLPDGTAESSDPVEALDVLTVNLKLTEAYHARLKQAIVAGKPNETSELEAEAEKVQREIENLRSNLLAVHNGTPGADSNVSATVPVLQNAILPEQESNSGAATALAAIEQQTNPDLRPVSKQPRNALVVEQAIVGTPGLQLLDTLQRETLRQKLVSGECLVPALTSVFPQVPVLVMRDMVRQLKEGC